MNKLCVATILFFAYCCPLFLKAQVSKNSFSIEAGYVQNATNFLGGYPYLLPIRDRDNYNYSVHPLDGFYLRGGYERKIFKSISADANLGFLRSGYQGRHLDSFYFLPSPRDPIFVRQEKWTSYRVNSLTGSIGLNFNLKNKIILRGGYLFQLPIWVNERTDLVKLHEFREKNSFDFISTETTNRFNEVFTGWEVSVKFNIWKKYYLSLGYQQLFDNGTKNPYYEENDRAPHFKQTLFAGLYCTF